MPAFRWPAIPKRFPVFWPDNTLEFKLKKRHRGQAMPLFDSSTRVRLSLVGLDIAYSVFNTLDLACVFVGDGHIEFFAQSIDQKELIHGIGFQIFNKSGFGGKGRTIDF